MKNLLTAISMLCAFAAFPQFIADLNTITTAVPTLSVPLDARQMSMGLAGVITSKDEIGSASTTNPALLAQGEQYMYARARYSNWLRAIAPAVNFFNGEAAIGFAKRHAVSMSFQYFSTSGFPAPGQFINGNAVSATDAKAQFSYAFELTPHWSVGTSAKYFISVLSSPGQEATLQSVATDLGAAYRRDLELDQKWSFPIGFGISMTNLGPKVSYIAGARKDFIPTEGHLGAMAGAQVKLGDFMLSNQMTLSWSKLLVPTPPTYAINSDGMWMLDDRGNRIVAEGYDPNVPVARAMYQSFYDAPDGAREEFDEVIHRIGNEFTVGYDDKLTVHFRQGLFLEAERKGARKYLTLGSGIEIFGFSLDAGIWKTIGVNTVSDNTIFISGGYHYVFGQG